MINGPEEEEEEETEEEEVMRSKDTVPLLINEQISVRCFVYLASSSEVDLRIIKYRYHCSLHKISFMEII